MDLPPEPTSATRARELARQHLAGACSTETLDTTLLVVTELVTNAVLHAGTRMRVTLEVSPERIRVGVRDDAHALPERRCFDPYELTGRGLALVEQLSASWGVDVTSSGKVVWSEIAA